MEKSKEVAVAGVVVKAFGKVIYAPFRFPELPASSIKARREIFFIIFDVLRNVGATEKIEKRFIIGQITQSGNFKTGELKMIRV